MFVNDLNYGYTPEWCYEEYDIEPYKGYRITRQFQRPCSLYANRQVLKNVETINALMGR